MDSDTKNNIARIAEALNSIAVLKEAELRLAVKHFNVSTRGNKVKFNDLIDEVARENPDNPNNKKQ